MKVTPKEMTGNFEVSVKRFYLPYVVTANCPVCGREVSRDFTDDYLSYPKVGVPFDLRMNCYREWEDGEEWKWEEHPFDVRVTLGITLEAVGDPTPR